MEAGIVKPYLGEFVHGISLGDLYPCWNLSLDSAQANALGVDLAIYGVAQRHAGTLGVLSLP